MLVPQQSHKVTSTDRFTYQIRLLKSGCLEFPHEGWTTFGDSALNGDDNNNNGTEDRRKRDEAISSVKIYLGLKLVAQSTACSRGHGGSCHAMSRYTEIKHHQCTLKVQMPMVPLQS